MKEPILTKGVITRDEAIKLAPDYVAYVEAPHADGAWAKMNAKFETLKKGQRVLTCRRGSDDRDTWVTGVVSAVIRNDPRAIDGPVVRFSNGEYSWRVDGCDYAAPIA